MGKGLRSAHLAIAVVGLLLLLSSAVMASGGDHSATSGDQHSSIAPPTPATQEQADEQHRPAQDAHDGDDAGDHTSEVTAHARRYPTSDLNGNTLLVGFAAVNLLVLSAAKLAAQKRGETR